MSWLLPGVIASIFGSISLALVFIYLYSQEKEKALLIWGIGYFISSFRFLTEFVLIRFGENPGLLIVKFSLMLISGTILLTGMYRFSGKQYPQRAWLAAGIGLLWVEVLVFSNAALVLVSIPICMFLGGMYLWLGYMILKSSQFEGLTRGITGWVFVFWGVHEAGCLFAGYVDWFVPLGFFFFAFFEILSAFGFLIMFFEMKNRELGERKIKYRQLFENAGVGITYLSLTGEVISLNEVAAKRFGVTQDGIVGQSFEHLFGIDFYNRLKEIFQMTVKFSKVISFVEQVKLPMGYRWEENHCTAIHDIEGDLTAFQIVTEDITARKHAESAFHETQQRLIESQDIVKLGWWEYDITNQQFEWSEETYRQFGVPLEKSEISQEYFLGLLRPDWIEKREEKMADLLENGVLENELPIICPDGEKRWIWIKGELRKNENGKPQRIFGMSQDITARKKNEEVLNENFLELRTLHEIDQIIVSGIEQNSTIRSILRSALDGIGMDAALLYEYQPDSFSMKYIAGVGLKQDGLKNTSVNLRKGIMGRIANEQLILTSENINNEIVQNNRKDVFVKEGFKKYFGVPLMTKGELKGVLEVMQRSPIENEKYKINLLESISNQIAIAIDNFQLYSGLSKVNLDLQIAYETTLEGWGKTLELRDQEIEGHSERVTELTIQLAREIGLSHEEIVQVRRGALLHDIGKMGIPDSILHKPGPLNEEEWKVMRQHPKMAYDYLKDIPFLSQAMDIPYCHHEKWDGSGYPNGLVGEQIPLTARLFAIVDVYDALSSNRPYREAWPHNKIIEYIQEQSGDHFDPSVVEVFLNRIKEMDQLIETKE
ncbi:MAG: PAS domain S-box protein [Anaerolineaceae bacterium]|nr:PAS domain S-box protein [Anaerolineaceae bacterium]